jgi:hypothetical protein
VINPDDLWTDEAGAVRRGAVAISGLEAVWADRDAAPPRGPLVGVVRFDVDETGAAPIVRVEVEVPPTDRRIGPGDPLVGVPCL